MSISLKGHTVIGNASDLSARSAALLEQIKSELKPGMEDSLQMELAELVNLIADFEILNSPDLLGQSEIAVAALFADPPNVQPATEIRKNITKRVRARRNPLVQIRRGIRSGTPPTRVVAGLGLLFYFAIPLIAVGLPALSDRKEILGCGLN